VALSTAVVLVLVLFVCWLYYDSLLVLFLLGLSVVIGSVAAFGLAYLIEGYVNANSAFLGSIVLGNGINFAIIFLARFVEEMEKRKGVTHAILLAFRKTDKATWVAAASAALSYGALMITDFRGFRQFGLIGFLGMVCCWLSAFTFLPASLMLAGKLGRFSAHSWRRRGRRFGQGLLYLVSRFPRTLLGTSALATVVSVFLLWQHWGGLLETNMSKLRDRHSEAEGSGYYSRYLHEIFGYPHPTVLLATSRAEAQTLAAALIAQKKQPASWIHAVHSLDDFLPEEMPEKARILGEIRAKVDQFGWEKLRRSERQRARELLADSALHRFGEAELPDFVLRRFREKDGSLGRMVLVEPPHSGEMETGVFLQQYVSEVRAIADSVRPGIPVTGQLAISADLGAAISRSGPRVTALALLFVVAFVAVLFHRPRHVFLITGTLICSIAWLFGLIIAWRFKINFVNFIAIPITLGISVDYGINIYQRYLQEKRNPISNALVNSGAAVFLASLTTIIGYASLLLAGNQAIASFGALATFGEITGLIAALLLIPSYLVWRESRS
jgi:predicted RND superfamily exporter protein